MSWTPYDDSAEVGTSGTEGGIIVRDDEHALGARITLEQNCGFAPWAITCGIYGYFFHTRYFSSQAESSADYDQMRDELAVILELIPLNDAPNLDAKMETVHEAIVRFVNRYP